MKVLHINTFDTGGAATAAVRQHLALLKSGVDSSMLFLYKSGNPIENSFQFNEVSMANNLNLIQRVLNRFKNKFFPKICQSEINKGKLENKIEGYEMFSFNTSDHDLISQKIYQEADVINVHWTAGFLDFSFFLKNKKPIVFTLHDMNAFTGGCHYSFGCDKYESTCLTCPQLKGTRDTNNAAINLEYKLEAFSKSQKVIVTSPSKWLSDCSEKSILFKTFENLVIPYSLSFDVFRPLDKKFSRKVLNLPLDKKIILFVSDNVNNKRKGFDLLLNAIQDFDKDSFHICCVGKTNRELLNRSNISFVGLIKDERLMSIAYNASDVFILPSLEDNLPNVMLESLACGVPVISFPNGGMLDFIETGKNGILTENATSESLKQSIEDFISEKYIFNSRAISEQAIQSFSQEKQAFAYQNVYNRLTQNKE
jgi:glycosyltransferase involved in cell wall biosynthesis